MQAMQAMVSAEDAGAPDMVDEADFDLMVESTMRR